MIMKLNITFNISGKALLLSVGIVAAIFIISGIMASVDTTKPYHPLQQIARTLGSTQSLDEDNDGMVDGDAVGVQVPHTGGTPKSLQQAIDDNDFNRIIMKTGTYTGNGQLTQSVTGVGIDLTSGTWMIMIYPQFPSGCGYYSAAFKSNVDTGTLMIASHGDDSNYCYYSDNVHGIISGDPDGFTVGVGHTVNGHIGLNELGYTYTYIIWKYI